MYHVLFSSLLCLSPESILRIARPHIKICFAEIETKQRQRTPSSITVRDDWDWEKMKALWLHRCKKRRKKKYNCHYHIKTGIMNGWSNHSFWAIIVLKSAQSFFCLRLLACNHKQSNKPPILRTTIPKKCKLVQNLENRFLTQIKSAFSLRQGLSNSNSV